MVRGKDIEYYAIYDSTIFRENGKAKRVMDKIRKNNSKYKNKKFAKFAYGTEPAKIALRKKQVIR